MNEELPPPTSPPPSLPPSRSEIAARAFIGLSVYLMAGLLALASRSPVGLGLLALPVIFALYTAITGKLRGFALGVFIGVGFTLLVFGMCMAIVSKM